MTAKEASIRLAPRQLTISFDKQEKVIRLWPPESITNREKKFECGLLPDMKPLQMSDSLGVDVHPSDPLVGILFVINHPVTTRSRSFEDIDLQVKGGGGWIELSANKEKFTQSALGRLRMVQVQGNIAELFVDDVPQLARSVETFTAAGELDAQFTQGKLRVWGKAQRLWRGEKRMNVTKWEKLGWEPRLALVSALVSALGFFGVAVGGILKRDEPFTI